MAAWAIWMLWAPARARAQPGAEAAPIVSVHPDVSTSLQLPDEIEDVRSADNHDIMVGGVGSVLYLRPRPNTPAGVEVFMEVKTRTLHRFFLVRVVEHAGEATERLVVPAPASGPARAALDAPPMMLTPPEPPESPAMPEPAPVPAPAQPAPDTPEPTTALAEPEPATAATTERPSGADSARFAILVQAVALAGTTEFTVPGYAPTNARQSHRAFGGRIAVGPRDARWAVEANISGEWPAASTTHDSGEVELSLRGPLLRADAGLRAGIGTRWMPTLYLGGGLQAHHRDTVIGPTVEPNEETRRMPFAGVLVMGVGLAYRSGDMLLGLELHVRQGVPAEYRSVSVSLSAGFFLDPGE